jgi:Immune inhibitor A peptidase M6, catalytic domain
MASWAGRITLPLAVGSLLLPLAAMAWTQTETKTHVLKVLLADFEDIPHPERYTREYFEELMFGLDRPRATPEGRPLSGSVREYFLNLSEGRIDIEGEVLDWVRIPRRITRIPHWKPGMTPFGESWPVIVAETLRGLGIVGKEAMEKVRLKDGRMPELLVFLNTDYGVGGVNRGWGHLQDVLGKMGLGDLWDDAWSGLPSPYSSFSATLWRQAPGSGPDGTIDRVPPASQLELFPLSIMMHEMGHQLAGWPDLYGPAFEPWGVFDLMGGPAASTHFPMGVSAYLRVSSGWMQYTDLPHRTQRGLTLEPLDTHKEALRFPQGPNQEGIIAENRWCLKYPGDYGQPPANEGPRLLLYRLDPAGRRRMMYGEHPAGKVTTMVRRPEHYGEVWGGEGFTEVTAQTSPSSRNSLGELWWEFRNIHPELPDAVGLDADFRAYDLVREYRRATWTDAAGAGVEAGRYGGSRGYVCLVSSRGEEGRPSAAICLTTAPGGCLRGRYDLPPGMPRRLYCSVSLGDGAPEGAALTIAPSAGEATRLDLDGDTAGQLRTVAVELPAETQTVELIVQAPSAATPARVDVRAGWVVGLPEAAAELWRATPTLTPDAPPLPAAGNLRLGDGCTYGPAVLVVPVGGGAPSERRAEWRASLPESAAMLRGLFGLAADAPTGGAVTVALTLVAGERTWKLVENLDLTRHAPEPAGADASGRDWPAVIEVALPAEARGQQCTIAMDVSTKGDRETSLAVPYLSVCRG